MMSVLGADSFAGRTIRLSRRDRTCDVVGQRVAVIGAGADLARLVPDLVGQASSVKVFQTAPAWVVPRLQVGPAGLTTRLYRHAPVPHSTIERLARAHLRVQVRDAWLRRQLSPDAPPRRRTLVASNDYYPALQRRHCKLITWPIARLCRDGIRTADGIEHHVDCIVFAPGYDPERLAV